MRQGSGTVIGRAGASSDEWRAGTRVIAERRQATVNDCALPAPTTPLPGRQTLGQAAARPPGPATERGACRVGAAPRSAAGRLTGALDQAQGTARVREECKKYCRERSRAHKWEERRRDPLHEGPPRLLHRGCTNVHVPLASASTPTLFLIMVHTTAVHQARVHVNKHARIHAHTGGRRLASASNCARGQAWFMKRSVALGSGVDGHAHVSALGGYCAPRVRSSTGEGTPEWKGRGGEESACSSEGERAGRGRRQAAALPQISVPVWNCCSWNTRLPSCETTARL